MAEGSRAPAFSVWIRLEPDYGARLKQLVEDLGTAFDAPPFAPHVTLLGNAPKGSEEEAKALVQKLAECVQPFEVKVLPEARFEGTWNQNVLLFVEETPGLLATNAKAKEVLNGAPAGEGASFAPPSRRPHLSLMYGDHTTEQREAAVQWILTSTPWAAEGFSFLAEEIELWGAAGGFSAASVPDWYHVATYKLGAQSEL
mmetsp:Transcript_36006/g.81328  ORF Transcript_36006/g.81328 Transcript_36006/m.81328 type:complete len:200 (-) Transcript_36006:26-625(-)